MLNRCNQKRKGERKSGSGKVRAGGPICGWYTDIESLKPPYHSKGGTRTSAVKQVFSVLRLPYASPRPGLTSFVGQSTSAKPP